MANSGNEAPLSHDPNWHRAGAWPAPQPGEVVDLMLVGVPTWRTSLSPTNAGVTPAAIRDALRRYSTHIVGADDTDASAQTVVDETLNIRDAGDVFEPDLDEQHATDQIAALARVSRCVVALGGDNALTVPTMLGVAGDALGRAGLVTLDAHHDLRDGRSNGSPVRRLIDAGLDPARIVQVGIADFANSKPYRDLANELGITVIHRDDLERRPLDDVMAEAFAIAGSAGGPIHVDLDVDVCDRSVAPACPASIPGGISAWQLRRAARLAGAHAQVQSIDIAEVDSEADAADGRTVRLAALLVLEAAAGITLRRREGLVSGAGLDADHDEDRSCRRSRE